MIDGVEIHVEGDGAEAIVMVHGWPDTCRLWDATVAALKDRFRCVRFTLPGFDASTPRRARTLDELCAFLLRVIEAHCPGRKAILLLHDWGCAIGYQFYNRHPEAVSRIIGVDIGDPASARRALSRREIGYILAYQWWLALAWKAGGRLGDRMTLAMARRLRCPSDPAPIGSRMNYPYWMTWFGGKDAYPRHSKRFEPACPMLFVYGRRKLVRFHSADWLERLRQRPGNRVEAFDTGHWVMLEQPERFNGMVREWLSSRL